MATVKVFGFTQKANGIARAIVSTCKISLAFDPATSSENRPPANEYKAIWDTGATSTVITQRVADECGLQPTGMAIVHTASGLDKTETYLVNVLLPNKVGVANVKVTRGKIGGDAEVLIGMDIITKGDFAISNLNGRTMVSFRIPSIEHIDFANRSGAGVKQTPGIPRAKVGRNDPCPCGSTKKFKKCCGMGM